MPSDTHSYRWLVEEPLPPYPVFENVHATHVGDRAEPGEDLPDVRLPGGRLQESFGGEACHLQDGIAVTQLLLGPLFLGNVADRLDGAHEIPLGIEEGRRRGGKIDLFPAVRRAFDMKLSPTRTSPRLCNLA